MANRASPPAPSSSPAVPCRTSPRRSHRVLSAAIGSTAGRQSPHRCDRAGNRTCRSSPAFARRTDPYNTRQTAPHREPSTPWPPPASAGPLPNAPCDTPARSASRPPPGFHREWKAAAPRGRPAFSGPIPSPHPESSRTDRRMAGAAASPPSAADFLPGRGPSSVLQTKTNPASPGSTRMWSPCCPQ